MKQRKSIIFILASVMAVGICASGCGKENSDIQTPVTNEVPTESETYAVNESTAAPKSEEEIMDMLWGDDLHCYAQLYYPGFTLGYKENNGSYLRTYTNTDEHIVVVENENAKQAPFYENQKIHLYNESVDKEHTIYRPLGGNSDNGNTFYERLFMYDITGDGRDEIIIRQTYAELGIHHDYIYIYDKDTLEEIKTPDNMGEKLYDSCVTDVQIEAKGSQTYQFIINDVKGNQTVFTKSIPDDITGKKWTGSDTSRDGLTIEDGKLTSCIVVGYNYDNHPWTEAVAVIKGSYVYNNASGEFELTGDYSIDDATEPASWNIQLMDEDLGDKALKEYEEWRNSSGSQN